MSNQRRTIEGTAMAIGLYIAEQFQLGGPITDLMQKQMNSPRNKRKAFAGYQPTKQDVFVATYSKSGTNWMMQIAQQIAYYGEAEYEHIHQLVPWPEAPLPSLVPLSDPEPIQKAPTNLRIIKTHNESQYVPYHPDAKYITVIRNPKDAFVSSYYFAHDMFGRLGFDYSLDEWLKRYLNDQFMFGNWAAHTASFWPWRDRENVLILHFAEMKRDLKTAVQSVAQLMQVPLTDEQLAKVIAKSEFSYMKKHAHRFNPIFPSIGKRPHVTGNLMRKGKIGSSGELINAQQQATIDMFCQAELKQLGSDFPYEQFFQVIESEPPGNVAE